MAAVGSCVSPLFPWVPVNPRGDSRVKPRKTVGYSEKPCVPVKIPAMRITLASRGDSRGKPQKTAGARGDSPAKPRNAVGIVNDRRESACFRFSVGVREDPCGEPRKTARHSESPWEFPLETWGLKKCSRGFMRVLAFPAGLHTLRTRYGLRFYALVLDIYRRLEETSVL